MSLKGAWKRLFAGMPLIMTQAAGPGHIAFSQDQSGELIALPIQPGSATIDASGVITMQGAGHAMGLVFSPGGASSSTGRSDGFYFLAMPQTGDATATVRVVTGPDATRDDDGRQAALMFRESLDQDARFVMMDQIQLDGPDNPGDPLPGFGYEVSDEAVKGQITGFVESTSTEILVGFKSPIFDSGFKAGLVLDWDYENTTEMQSGTVQKAELTLRTTTLGYHDVINVYEDTLFGTFAFVSVGHFPPGTEVVSGTVTDAQDHPVSNQRVLVRMPDGITRTVFTNSRGIYRVFGGRVGTARVQIGGQERTVPIEAGKMHDASMRLGTSAPAKP